MNVIREILDAAPWLVKDGGSVWMEEDNSPQRKLGERHFEGVEYVKQVNDMYGNPLVLQLPSFVSPIHERFRFECTQGERIYQGNKTTN